MITDIDFGVDQADVRRPAPDKPRLVAVCDSLGMGSRSRQRLGLALETL